MSTKSDQPTRFIHYPLHWIHSQNFGDALNPYLYRAITGRDPVIPRSNDSKIIACGSLAHEAKPGDLVWGTGAMSPELPLQCDESTQVFAVRGPLTAALFRGRGKTIHDIYGDPALLLPLFFERASRKEQQLGIVPHYVDEEHVRACGFGDDMIISPMTPFEQFIHRVTACEIIVSSALHGIITAEAYGIPAVWVEFSDNVAGHGFKFRDYYSGTYRDNVTPLDARNWSRKWLHALKTNGVVMKIYAPERPIYSRTLLDVCPFDWTTTDYRRWQSTEFLAREWRSRTTQMAALIRPGQSVIEFGCGDMHLKSLLPRDCTYVPSDVVSRSEDTLVCDLNAANLPVIAPHDVAVFAGVLEYIHNLPRLAWWLSNISNTVILSYASHGNADERASNGWVNSYTLAGLVEIFTIAGYRCVHNETWQSQTILEFVKV